MNGFNQDTAELFYRREADQADVLDRMAQASRILGTPSPAVAGVVNLDDPSQAAQMEITKTRNPVMTPLEYAHTIIDGFDTGDRWQFAALAHGLLDGYDARWRNTQADIELLEVEQTYGSSLVNPKTARSSRTFSVAGKIDKLTQHAGRVLYDHKTTSMDISDPASVYWRQLVIEGQASHYELLLLQNGIKLDRIVWDVVRKPGIRPKKIAKQDILALQQTGDYCGYTVTSESYTHAINRGDENAELFACRVAQETTENPDRYFQRRSVPRTRDELAEYASELWDIATEIREARRNDRWYRNSGACMSYGTPCKFLGICSGHDTPESDRWTRKQQVHNELDLDGDGRDVLTNSRIRCFQTCRRKHFYEYELGLSRVDEEEREALFFGGLWHSALDAWWSAVSQGVENDYCNEKPVIEVGGSEAGPVEQDATGLPF